MRPNYVVDSLADDGTKQWMLLPDANHAHHVPIGVMNLATRQELWFGRGKVKGQKNRVTTFFGGRDTENVMHLNAAKNAEMGGNDWSVLWDTLKGCRLLLLSSGPSLAKALARIKKERKKPRTVLMGSNRAILAAEKGGFDLDFYLVTERQGRPDWVKRKQKGKLICATTSNPEFGKLFTKKNRFYGEMLENGVDLGYMTLNTGMGNCAIDAILAAFKLGVSEIHLYGYDCAIEVKWRDTLLCPKCQRRVVPDKKWQKKHARKPQITLCAECRIQMQYGKRWAPGKYYWDTDVADHKVHKEGGGASHMFVVKGVGGIPVGVTYQLMCTATYTEVACRMVEEAGVKVVNMSGQGYVWHGVK